MPQIDRQKSAGNRCWAATCRPDRAPGAASAWPPGCQCPRWPMTIRVILADDQPLVRAGLRLLIEQTPDIDVAGEAGTGAEAVQLARDTGPDVAVMDIRMPGMDGIEATQMIAAGDTHARVLVLTTTTM